MDEYSGRKGVDGLAVRKRGSRIISRDPTKSSRDQNIQFCNRIGCSGRLNPATAKLDKTKVLKASPDCSANDKVTTGKSSKGVPKVTAYPVKPLRLLRNKTTLSSEADSSASSGSKSSYVQKAEIPNSNFLPDGNHRSLQLDHKESQSDESSLIETDSHSAVSNGRTKRTPLKKPLSVVDSSISSLTHSGSSKNTPQLSRQNASATRPGSRYVRCSSTPDAALSQSVSGNRKQMLKRSSERQSSSSSGVKQTALAGNTPINGPPSGISISEARQARRAQTGFRDNFCTSERARKLDNSTAHLPPQMAQHELPTGQHMRRLPNSQSATGYPHRPLSFARPSTAETSRSRNLTSPSGVPYSRNLGDREGHRHYNLSGITEMLLALDRTEHDEEMSYERILALESTIVLGGLSFHDQHRHMRLDIDNMSYEELLALEERMGSVSTALSEEALAKCIKKKVYKPCPSATCFSDTGGCEDDTKCSICQEEYNIGDAMGKLHCKHSYHVDCIDQWLRQKNWCPICKSSAAF